MDREKLRRKIEHQSVRDHTNMRRWADRRHRRYEKLMDEPVLPRFCTLCFICLIVCTFATVSYDIYNSLAFHQDGAIPLMLKNAASSAFFTWLIFAAMVIPSTAIQLKRGFDDPYFERFLLNRRGKPRMPLKKRFRLYLMISSVGLVLFFMLYLMTRIFLA